MLCCKSSTNATKIITPAENPIINEINRGFCFFITSAITLPIVVDNPAIKLSKIAKKACSIVNFTLILIDKLLRF